MRGRNHGQGLAGQVETEGLAVLGDGGEMAEDELGRLVRDIEINAIGAKSLHLVVDGSRHDISGRQLGARVKPMHESFAVRQQQTRPFAA